MPTRPFTVQLILLLGLLCLASAGAVGYLAFVRPVAAVVQESTGQVIPRLPPSVDVTPVPTQEALTASSGRRMNILLLGSDTDDKFGGVYDTQIMIVVSIDEQRKQLSMLSIPRDLWVQIPNWGMGKIGTAYHDGGLALTRQTIEEDLGIPIDYYAWVGLDGFVKVIDTLGGVDLDVAHPVVDDRYPDDLNTPNPYAYRRLYIPAGPQHLDGARALEYVRSRHGDLAGDFGRSNRQQQLLQAIRARTNGKDLAAHLPELALDLRDSIKTDLQLIDLARLARLADQLGDQPVQRYFLSPPRYSSEGWSRDGQQIIIPDWPAIHQLVSGMLG
ncbi:MAG TPA: LCP family protein [Chloroflexota bacterium]|nr:LCP family protein [Chloroflexota bacterium]